MSLLRTPFADAEALFLHTLQPLLDLAAFVGRLSVYGICVVAGAALLAVAARRWQEGGESHVPFYSPTPRVVMTRTLLLIVALLLAAPAFAQTHADPMARLAPFEGTYSLDGTPHMAPEGSFGGTLTIAPTLGGHFQQWDWEMTMRESNRADETVHLRFIVGYDPATGAYTIHRFDSRDAGSRTRSAGAFDAAEGRLQVDGESLVMAWSSASDDEPARTGTFRNRVRLTGGGLLVETEGVPDDGSPTVAIATTRAARR